MDSRVGSSTLVGSNLAQSTASVHNPLLALLTTPDVAERAAFVVCLEVDSADFNADEGTVLDGFAHAMLHGKGYDRWYDKSFNIIVMKNGRVSCPIQTKLNSA